jgi:hypothetical protein
MVNKLKYTAGALKKALVNLLLLYFMLSGICTAGIKIN